MIGAQPHIAVVDDDASFSRALGRMLRASGINVAVYPSAEDFLRGDARGGVDCVILDVQLGGMSGLALRRHMLASGWAPPVIFVTALDEPETRRTAHDLACAAYLRKPFSGALLVDAIGRALGTCQMREKPPYQPLSGGA